jgi:hypothetical protein
MINFSREDHRKFLIQLLSLRQDKRYRAGLIQGAVSFGIISQDEWISIKGAIDKGEKIITLQGDRKDG